MKAVLSLLSVMSFVLLEGGTAAAQETVKPITVLQDSSPTMYGRSARIRAKVEAIDLAARELTLKGQKGRSLTLRVEERVRNLPQIRVGDDVTVRYHESVGLEVRKAQEGETVAIDEPVGNGAQSGQKPAAGSRQKTVIGNVESVNPKERSLTLKAPQGHFIDLYVRDQDVLGELAAGDRVVATYTEAAAVSVEPTKKKKK